MRALEQVDLGERRRVAGGQLLHRLSEGSEEREDDGERLTERERERERGPQNLGERQRAPLCSVLHRLTERGRE